MIKSKFAISVHILTLLAGSEEEWMPSEIIASSLNTNAALVRKELSALRQAGLVESKEGKNGGSRLGRSAASITMAEIFSLVKEDHVFGFSPNLPNPKCPVGAQINDALDELFTAIDETVYNRLRQVTLADFSAQFVY
ncbi:Rrf2 family transcriptional regulator [Chitinophaga pendula]|uniref:Rrf2 family transcriptional regulator n=1 Tax=Chitinophaga TaxID=79328 RepID=UPI000BAEE476|nr:MULTISPECIES: Rrf2 family transcriptional regulator [Chitinophaga]ASZ13949.1 transcriptional regulator [Chitinophaga sp. MD30]UCJ08431.1 Rrf2 family transcriptional regulator [Chitinophaga pendula]